MLKSCWLNVTCVFKFWHSLRKKDVVQSHLLPAPQPVNSSNSGNLDSRLTVFLLFMHIHISPVNGKRLLS